MKSKKGSWHGLSKNIVSCDFRADGEGDGDLRDRMTRTIYRRMGYSEDGGCFWPMGGGKVAYPLVTG